MPTTKKATTAKSAGPDAVALLTADHKEVKAMLKEFETMKKGDADGEAKAALVDEVPPPKRRATDRRNSARK